MTERPPISPDEWESLQTQIRESPLSTLARARTFGNYLKLKCEEEGFSIKELARKSKLSPSTIRRAFRNPLNTRSSTIRGIFAALEVSSPEQSDIWRKFDLEE